MEGATTLASDSLPPQACGSLVPGSHVVPLLTPVILMGVSVPEK